MTCHSWLRWHGLSAWGCWPWIFPLSNNRRTILAATEYGWLDWDDYDLFSTSVRGVVSIRSERTIRREHFQARRHAGHYAGDGRLVFIKQHLLDRELLRLLRTSRNRLRI